MSSENLDFTSKIMAWCQDNLKYLIIGALIGIIIPLSWNYYKHLRTTENLVASDLYGELVNLIDSQEDYKNIEWDCVAKKMKKPAWVFDARSIVNIDLVKKSGINIWSLGDGSSQDKIEDF